MKKRASKKLSLHRETLVALSDLKRPKGAEDSFMDCTEKCVSGPIHECIHTLELGCIRD